MKATKQKQIPLDELQERARLLTRAALENYVVPKELGPELTLGVGFEGDDRVFELYVPGDKPEGARVISRARLNSLTGEGTVEVFLDPRSSKD